MVRWKSVTELEEQSKTKIKIESTEEHIVEIKLIMDRVNALEKIKERTGETEEFFVLQSKLLEAMAHILLHWKMTVMPEMFEMAKQKMIEEN